MALVIEDGSLVAEANSYVSVEMVREFAVSRAITSLPVNDSAGNLAIEAACVLAGDYLESFRGEFKGSKVSPATQWLQWPRQNVRVEGWEVPITTIPKELKFAQCQLVIENLSGVDLSPTGDGREIIKEKVDVLEVEYAQGSNNSPQPHFVKVRHFLEPLLDSGSGFTLRSIRA